MNSPSNAALFCLLLMVCSTAGYTQQITGTWKGKINSQRVELKIVQHGDSLTGTSYYHPLAGSNRRYSIKGYFDPYTNSVVWWDDELLTADGASPATNSQLSVADFNCPGGGRMFLEGKSSRKEEPQNPTGKVNLTKADHPSFHDEWDYVLDNYPVSGWIIDSVSRIAMVGKKSPAKQPVEAKMPAPAIAKAPIAVKASPPPLFERKPKPAKPLTIEEKFAERKKVFTREIAIEGDSIQLHFYDNAEVDGDSITLFLNNKMIFTHVRLTANPYTVTLAVKELAQSNELVMVAENLGSIPPNTALMLATIGGKRYEAYLESTEETSCLIRFTKVK